MRALANLGRVGVLVVCALVLTAGGTRPESVLGNYRLVHTKTTATYLELAYRADLTNPLPRRLVSAGAILTGLPTGTTVIDGKLSFGGADPGATVTSQDTFIVRQDLTIPLDLSRLAWTVLYNPLNRAPVADAGPDQAAAAGTRVTLDGRASSDPDGDPLKFWWRLVSRPPGSQAQLSDASRARPSFLVDREGTYVVDLLVADGKLVSVPDRVEVTTGGLANTPPVANAGPDQTVPVGTSVQLDASAATDQDGHLLTFQWRFVSTPSGSGAVLSDPAALRPTFTVDRPGTFVVELVVNDGRVDSTPDLVQVSTVNSRPIASAGPDQTVPVGATVVLDGRASGDVDLDPLSFRWAFVQRPVDSAAALDDPSAVGPSFIADLPGRYVVRLIVDDGLADSVPDTVQIDTLNSPPVADAGPDLTGVVGTPITLDGRTSADADGDPLTFRWSFTTRPDTSETAFDDPALAQPTFVPDLPGDYVAQLIVNDGTLDSVPDTALVTVTGGNQPPVASAGPDQTVARGVTVRLDGTGSSDSEGAPLTFAWTLLSRPSGSAATLAVAASATPTFVADTNGDYVARLIVSDGGLESAPDTVTVTVMNGADLRVEFVNPPTTPPIGSAVTLFVDIRNDGPAIATDVLARFQVPSGYAVTHGGPSAGTTYDVATGHWIIGTIPSGGLARIILGATVNPTGPYDLTAAVTSSGAPDPNLANNAVTVLVTPNRNADLRVEFFGVATTPPIGSAVTLFVDIRNDGPAIATDVLARFQVPSGYAVTHGGPSAGTTYDVATGHWIIGTIPSGGLARIILGATVNPTGPYDLTAAVTSSGAPDPNLANNAVTVLVTPNRDADLRLEFFAPPSGTLSPGAAVTIFLDVRNGGPANTTGVRVRLPVPAGYTITGGGPGVGAYDSATGDWTIGPIPNQTLARMILSARVNPTGPTGFTASIIASDHPDPNLANNSLTVPPINRPPVADAGPDQAAATGATVILDGRASSDAEGDAITFQWIFTLRPVNSTATLAGADTPTPSFVPDLGGTYRLQLVVTDSHGAPSVAATTSVVASVLNQAPTIRSAPVTTAAVGLAYRYGVDALDPDAGDLLSFSLPTAPAGMTVDASTGVIRWTPAEAQAGPQAVVVRAQDPAGRFAQQAFEIQVSSTANPAPVAADDAYQVRRTESLGIGAPGVLANDTDAGGAPLTAVLLSRPANGALTLNSDGSFVYTPHTLQAGELVLAENVDLIRAVPGVTFNADGNPGSVGPPCVTAACAFDDNLTTHSTAGFGNHPTWEVVFPQDVIVTEVRIVGARIPFQNRVTEGTFQLLGAAGTVLHDSGPVGLPLPDRDAALLLPGLDGVRRVRFTATSAEAGSGSAFRTIAEMQVRGSARVRRERIVEPNLAQLLPATVQATGFLSFHIPESVIDDNDSTSWYAPGNAGDFIQVTFPVDVTVSRLQALNAAGRPDGFGTSLELNCFGIFQMFDAAGAVLFDSGLVNTPRGVPHPSGEFTRDLPNVAGVRRVRYTMSSCPGSFAPAGFSEIRVFGTAAVTTPAFRLDKKFQALLGREAHSTPVVINLTDDNGDGVIDARDIPDIVVPVESLTSQLSGEIKVLSGYDGRLLFTAGGPDLVSPWSEVAVGDIDGDGLPDIVAVHSDGNHLIAFDNTGAVKWISDPNAMPSFVIGSSALFGGAVAIANLDGGSRPHIIVGASVFDADGRLLGDGRTLGGTTGGTGLRSAISAIVDLDLDGIPEIVAGPTAYRLVNGRLEIVWRRADLPDGYVAIGNFDDDPFPEIVIAADGRLYLLDHDGTDAEVWNAPTHGPVSTPGAPEGSAGPANGQSGAPLVADVDGDGVPEVGIAKFANYLLYNRDGSLRWKAAISDRSSHSTGSTAFDFDGDGTVEIVYRDEKFLRIFRGADGVLVAKVPVQSATWAEQPVVVDVDNDGHADIVVTSDLLGGTVGDTGVVVFRDVANQWTRTRRIWNQHGYHVTNVNEDGTIPRVVTPNWLVPGLNNFRVNSFLPGETADELDSFTYLATDGVLDSNVATVRIAVRTQNSAPRFTSAPVTSAAVGVAYVYGARAGDPDAGDVLTFSLPTAPAGMAVEATTGLVHWTPTLAQLGSAPVVVRVQDARGLFALQSFTVQVASPVTVPDVVGQPQGGAQSAITAAGLAVGAVGTRSSATVTTGAVISQNPVAGTLAAPGSGVSLVVSLGAPPTGVVPDVVGQSQAAAQADISAAGFTSGPAAGQNSTLVPLGIVLSQAPAAGTTAPAGSAVSLVVSLGPPPGDVDADGDGLTGNQGDCDDTNPGVRPGALDTPGDGIDQNCNGRDSIAGDDTPPTVSLDSPAEDAVITLPTDIVGTATDANFLRYTLEVAGVDETAFTRLAAGTAPVVSGVLGRIDPTLLENGMYRVRLAAEDVNGRVSIAERVYRVAGEAKAGIVAMSFLDLHVPVSGVPISVVRSYDSRVKTQRDFGIGWSLQVKAGTYRNNRRPGDGWRVTTAPGPFGLPCSVVDETSSHVTELRLSDREVYLFRPRLTGLAAVIGGCVGTVVYDFSEGTLPGATLQVLGNTDIIYTSGETLTEFDGGTDTGLVFDPRRVRLTTIEGRTIDFDRAAGVTRVEDSNGNALTITPAGITHTSGKSIAFARDSRGRLVGITDPNGNRLAYAYDASGDLVEFVDQVANRTTFTYDGRHNLLEVHDPVGNRAFQGEYDADGRVIAMIDARGRRVQFTHDVEGRLDVTTDARGNVRRLAYDASGNIESDERAVTIEGTLRLATTAYVHDAAGNATVEVDPDGVRVESAFDHQDPLEQTIDPQGLALRTRFTYDATARPLTVTNPAGETATLAYDRRGNLLRWDDPLGNPLHLSYDQGRPTRTVDALGGETRVTYDTAGNVVRLERFDALGVPLSREDYAYDANGNRISATAFRTVSGGLQPLTTTWAYDGLNRVVATTDPAGNVTRTIYNGHGLKAAEIDALGRRTDYTYDVLGTLIRTDLPDGTFETREYDEAGNLVRRTDQAARATTFEYDELNREILRRLPDGSTRRTVYTPAGRVAAVVDGNGARTDFVYDTAGRQVRTILPEVLDATTGVRRRPEIVLERDATGRLVASVDPNGHRTAFAYDAGGRKTLTTYPDGTTRQDQYDALGRAIERRDEAGRVTRFEYDPLGRLAAVIDALGGRTAYAYDEVGNLLSQTDARGRRTTHQYDVLGRRVETILPGGQRERFTQDAEGNLVSRTDFNGATVTYQYDALNRLVGKRFPDGSTVAFTYTATGRRATAVDSRGTTRYEYDTSDHLSRVIQPTGEIIDYGYDTGGNLRQVATPGGAVSYERDGLRRLTSVAGPAGEIRYGYDPAGNLVEVTRPNGVVTRRTYDARRRLTDVRETLGSATLGALSYELSPTGRRLRAVELDGSAEAYAFDPLDRLVSESRTGAGPRSIAYQYDAVGNRTATVRDGVPTAYTYDVNDRLLAAGTTTFAHDANGNMVSRTAGGVTTTYAWDLENRLVASEGPSGLVQLAYDVDGNLVGRRSGAGDLRLLVDANNTTGFSQVLEERDDLGRLRAHYTFGLEPLAATDAGRTSFHHTDGLGSVRLLTDGTGLATDTYGYEAYGSLALASGSTSNPYRFAGEWFEPGLALYYLRARWMDPTLGRFVSRDPFPGFDTRPLGQNKYLYADGDPVNRRDPSGLQTLIEVQTVLDIIGTLSRMTTPILRLYETASRLHDVLIAVYTLGNVLQGLPGYQFGLNGPATGFHEFEDQIRSNLFPDVEEAAEVIAENVTRVLGAADAPWIRYLLTAGHPVNEFLLYAPSFVRTPEFGVQLTNIRLGRNRIPLRLVFGGPGSSRLAGTGLGLASVGRHQIWRAEYHPVGNLPGRLPRIGQRLLDQWRADGHPAYYFYVLAPPAR